MAEARNKDCPCRRTSCKIHGQCEACKAYHHSKGKLALCEKRELKKTS